MSDYETARRNMIVNQLRPSAIEDARVLEAMGAVPREAYLPKPLRGVAYADEDIRLPDGTWLIEPLACARMLQSAEIGPDDVALVLGDGTGYVAAVVARLAATVFLLTGDADRAQRMESQLDSQGVDNVVVVTVEDPAAGHPSQAPFDVILIAGEVRRVPEPVLEQLGEGGRLIAVIEDRWVGKGTRFTRLHGVIGSRVLFDAAIPPVAELQPPVGFVFD